MKIVIDSNIFISDFGFCNPNWKVLAEYNSLFEDVEVCIPQVIIDEVHYHHSCKLEEVKCEISKLHKKFKSLGVENTIEVKNNPKSYIELFTANLPARFIPYPTDILEELIKRTIKRIKPAKKDGKDVRDTLIWLQIKDLGKEDKNNEILFITENVTDFCSPNSKCLSTELKNECDDINISVKLCTSLKMIVEDHITPLLAQYSQKNISITKLQELTSELNFGDIVCETIRNEEGYYDYFKENYGYGYDGITNADIDKYVIANYTATPLENGSVIVNMVIGGECQARPFDVDDPKELSIQCYDPLNIKYTLDCVITLKDNAIADYSTDNIEYELD